MSDFVYLYRGGTAPQTEDEGRKVFAAWTGWFERLGSSVKDPGNPFGAAKRISADGAVGEASTSETVGGYSIVTAGSLDEAVTMAKDCPALESGSTVTVHEVTPAM